MIDPDLTIVAVDESYVELCEQLASVWDQDGPTLGEFLDSVDLITMDSDGNWIVSDVIEIDLVEDDDNWEY